MDETTKWVIAVVVGAIIVIWFIVNLYKDEIKARDRKIKEWEVKTEAQLKVVAVRDENIKKFELLIQEQKLGFQKEAAELKLSYQQWAFKEFEKFKLIELDNKRKEIEKVAFQNALNLLQKWKGEFEDKIRKDAANRSYSVVLGKALEHLIPFHQDFVYNSQDVRFIGAPIDLIVFDGISEDLEEINIYFLEVKSGKSRLSSKQQKIKSAVENKRIWWRSIDANKK